jgi:hypothetical protein
MCPAPASSRSMVVPMACRSYRGFRDQFLDLLSLANLSGVILEGYSGWYLGADGAPHAHMDTDMHQLAKNLKSEESANVRPRGLKKGSDAQSFEIYITVRIREIYEGLFKRMMKGVRRELSCCPHLCPQYYIWDDPGLTHMPTRVLV